MNVDILYSKFNWKLLNLVSLHYCGAELFKFCSTWLWRLLEQTESAVDSESTLALKPMGRINQSQKQRVAPPYGELALQKNKKKKHNKKQKKQF